jgi:hypothetical protein
MKIDQAKRDPEVRGARRFLSKVHVGLAAFGTLAAVFGIAIAIVGGLQFNRTKVFVGVGIIVVSTILYVSMLFVPDLPDNDSGAPGKEH